MGRPDRCPCEANPCLKQNEGQIILKMTSLSDPLWLLPWLLGGAGILSPCFATLSFGASAPQIYSWSCEGSSHDLIFTVVASGLQQIEWFSMDGS